MSRSHRLSGPTHSGTFKVLHQKIDFPQLEKLNGIRTCERDCSSFCSHVHSVHSHQSYPNPTAGRQVKASKATQFNAELATRKLPTPKVLFTEFGSLWIPLGLADCQGSSEKREDQLLEARPNTLHIGSHSSCEPGVLVLNKQQGQTCTITKETAQSGAKFKTAYPSR